MRRKVLQQILRIMTKLIIARYKPIIVGITGSVGKTSTKEAISTILEPFFLLRKSTANLNTEIGVPLVFLGQDQGKNNLVKWLKIILSGIKLILFRDKNYPKLVIAEMGADRPNDISYLVKMAKPKVAVVTALGSVPVHVEYYKDIQDVKNEKAKIVECLDEDGWAILNSDDKDVLEFRKNTKAKVITFGFSNESDVLISSFQYHSDGISFEVSYKDKKASIKLNNHLAKSSAYAFVAGLACKIALGIDFREKIDESTKAFLPTKGRMNLISGINNSLIIDDSYNAAPPSVRLALEALNQMNGRKICVLGDMLELGNYSQEEHEKINPTVLEVCDYIFTIGNFSKYFIHPNFDKNKSFHFVKSQDAIDDIKQIIQPKDIILVKGSQSIRTEKIIKSIMCEPEKSKDLLVRQDKEWQ